MTTIEEKLNLLNNTKSSIKSALVSKGATPSDVFSSYSTNVTDINITTSTLNVVNNGDYTPQNGEIGFSSVHVEVPSAGGSTYSCVNKTGSDIVSGNRVYIASNSNLTLLNPESYNKLTGWTGIATENIANGATGLVSSYMTAPAGGLTKYTRVGDKATVAGFFTDSNNTTYAVCVLDANTRSNSVGDNFKSSSCPEYNTESEALAAKESATYLNELMHNDGWSYPGSITYEGQEYKYLRPNIAELKMILDDAANLDSYDPTASAADRDETLVGAKNSELVYTSTNSSSQAWYWYNGWKNAGAGFSSYNTKVWILEIPVTVS